MTARREMTGALEVADIAARLAVEFEDLADDVSAIRALDPHGESAKQITADVKQLAKVLAAAARRDAR